MNKMSEEIKEEIKEEVKEEKKESKKEAKAKKNEKIEKLEKELEEKNNQMLRLAAEYDNFRKRSQREKDAIYGETKAQLIGELLAVADNFERALANQNGSAEDLRKGFEMISKQFDDILAKNSVEKFGERGEDFDPNIHSGVMHVDDETLGENVIAEVFSKGYRMGDRIIRHAVVQVAN